MQPFRLALCCLSLCLAVLPATAQGKGEDLGTKDTGDKQLYLTSEMATLHSSLKPELSGVHPRVYFTNAELDALRTRAHGSDKVWWQQQLAGLRALAAPPPPPPAEKRRQQNNVALAMAEAAFAYRMEGDPRYLAAARQYMDAAVSYSVWGYSWSKPNVDLAAAHLLYGMGFAYDLLYNDLTPAERTKYRDCIALHGHLMYAAFAPRPGRSWSYSQNHTFIPMAGLGVAAYAVYGEVPEAAQWAALSRAIFDRVLATYSKDGYYYEGFEYWIFSTPWMVHYLDALDHAAGQNLFDQPGLRQTHLYAAFSLTPGAQTIFDFGDVFAGPITRDLKGEDYERSHPQAHFETNYNLLYDLAARFGSAEIQGVADWMRAQGHTAQEEWWTLAWRNPKLVAQPIEKLQSWHWFRDHDVAYWRSGWSADATAIAFKCGPPEGHSTAELQRRLPDWNLEDGHTHPDANSFIVWAHGAYLTGDSGYAGVPHTVDHNTLLVNGRGQGNEGTHDAWKGFAYDRLDHVRIVRAEMSQAGFNLIGEAASAYATEVGLSSFSRELKLTATGKLTVSDVIQTAQPARFTELLHADRSAVEQGKGSFQLNGWKGSLTAHLLQPDQYTQSIEQNIVMGPGIPGSVDKGTLEQRGERIAIVTTTPASAARFVWEFDLQAPGSAGGQ